MKPSLAFPLTAADRRRLLDIARRVTGTQADAEDAVHDACVRALSAGGVADIESPLAWLTTVVRHAAIDGLRRRQRERRHDWPANTPAPSAEDDAAALQARANALRHVAEALAPTDAAMLLLREVFGFSHAALAECSGQTEAACRQRVRRALIRLRRREHREPDDRAGADALYLLCLRAMQSHSPAALLGILHRPLSARVVVPRAAAGVAHRAAVGSSAPGRSVIVQAEGGAALLLMHEGELLCCMPLGPLALAEAAELAC